MQKHQVADRLFMCVIIALVSLASFSKGMLPSYGLTPLDGWAANASRAALIGLMLLALADTVINDMLPDNFRIGISLKYRQLVWMLLATTLTGYAYISFRYGADKFTATWLLLFGARCVTVAFIDLRHEIINSRRGRRRCETS